MIRKLGYYGFFVAIATLIHYVVIQPPFGPLAAEPQKVDVAALMHIAALVKETETAVKQAEAALEKDAPKPEVAAQAAPAAPPEPAPPPPAPKQEEPKPEPPKPEPEPRFVDNPEDKARLAELEKKLAVAEAEKKRAEQEKQELARKAAEAEARAKQEEQEKVAVARRRADEQAALRRSEQEKQEIARNAELDRQRAEIERKELEERLKKASELQSKAELEERALKERLESAFADAAAAEKAEIDDTKVPRIQFTGSKGLEEYVELQRFYGMKVIVYPEATRRFLCAVDLATGEIEDVRDPKAFLARFHTKRAIAERGAYWDRVAEKVARRMGVLADGLTVMTIFPNRTARYLGWKEIEVCRRAGVRPEEISTAVCTYERGASGNWIVRVIELIHRDGRAIRIRDFEGVPGQPHAVPVRR